MVEQIPRSVIDGIEPEVEADIMIPRVVRERRSGSVAIEIVAPIGVYLLALSDDNWRDVIKALEAEIEAGS